MTEAPRQYSDAAGLADAVIAEVGPNVVLALPLGLGKANHIANALYARALQDPALSLTVFTALTLEQPRPKSELERRFVGPLAERLFAGYPALAYAEALRAGKLPGNVTINEFYLPAGRWLGVPRAQQDYISANYTHVMRYALAGGVNVLAQLVAKRQLDDGTRYSLSCNPDLTLDALAARLAGTARFVLVGEVNDELPFMGGAADLPAAAFAHVLDGPDVQFPLFGPPKTPVSLTEYAIALHVARLIEDDGTLQIGIGSIGDAVVQALLLRHRQNAAFRELAGRLTPPPHAPATEALAPFRTGLHGTSEMLVDGFLRLIDAGILSREVDGAVLHAAFFLGPREFYQALREMPEAQRARIRMTAISEVNELYGDEAKRRAERPRARFVNKTMTASLLGSVASDTLPDGRVVSGVGGQYNFVAQAFALDDARSILVLDATRRSGRRTLSNIVWQHVFETIPRHLRDVVVTEYGAADLRGRSDAEVIAAMLEITDSRFQPELMARAKAAGKLPTGYEIPQSCRDNTPARIVRALGQARAQGLLPAFPGGTDFTEVEQRLLPVLQRLRRASQNPAALVRLVARGIAGPALTPAAGACLARLDLEAPSGLRERFYRALVRGALLAPRT